MTAPAQIAVTPPGVQVLAGRCATLADGFAPGAPVATVSGWQSNAAAVSRLDALAGKINTAAASRMRTTGTKLSRAASGFADNEVRSARQMPQVPVLV